MTNWKETRFKDFITLQRGYDLFKNEYREGIYPVVGATEIAGFHDNFKVFGPGITVGRVGSIGNVQYIQENFWPHQDCLYVKDFKGNDVLYVYYLLIALPLSHLDAGGAVPALNRNHLGNIKIDLPPLKTQQRIASILNSYDRLIEVNNQRIKLLEETASELYKEWFVRMRFPSYQQKKFIKGFPVDWKITTLADEVNFKMGQSPKSEFYNEEGKGLPFHQGVGTYGLRFPEHKIFCSVNGRTAEDGDILFSVRAPVGRLNIADRKLIIGRGLSAMKHKKGLNNYLYYLLQNEFSKEDLIGNGSIFNSVGKDELKKFRIFDVGDLAKKFNTWVQPIDNQLQNLIQQNTHLHQIRDRLLPRLISGKLQVNFDKILLNSKTEK